MGSFKSPEVHLSPCGLEFTIFSGNDIRKMSAVRIFTGLTFDALGNPLPGGLYDQRMGPLGRKGESCATCLNKLACTGHIGHIELSTLVFNPFFIHYIQKLLCIFCLHCFKAQLKEHVVEITTMQLQLIDAGYITEAQELELYKSELVLQNTEERVKLENGDAIHPRVAQLKEKLAKGPKNASNNTQTTYALRSAIINAAFQRPAHSKCSHCSKPLRTVRYLHRKLVYFIRGAELKNKTGQNKLIFADECQRYLQQIYKDYAEFLQAMLPVIKLSMDNTQGRNVHPMDIFFMDTIPVTPPQARPLNMVAGNILEHPRTAIYRNIIESDGLLRIIIKQMKGGEFEVSEEAKEVIEKYKGSTQHEKFYNAREDLQTSVNLLLDTNMAKTNITAPGLKQILEKKEGLIRKHMMGKRVNYAARTVITPDPNINVDEVGIPVVFAKKLSYPVPVTQWNAAELRKMVLNGPDKYPGANFIQDERGNIIWIPADNPTKREALAKLLYNLPESGIKIVHRHVINGDALLLNRQPSLHKPSIMAHKARVLTGEKTFRLHYSNCKAYNADFDGDEMNAHLPQNEVARSEAYNLVNVANNYLVPKDGTPLGGLIQDHVISGVKLSLRGRFFNRDDYCQLVFQALANCIGCNVAGTVRLLPPAILKPMHLWSGKQVLSTIIMNVIPEKYPKINLESKAKIAQKHLVSEKPRQPCAARLSPKHAMCESEVIIRNGELLVGVLDKQQYGATTFGLIHCIYELYGGEISTRLLTAFTKVFAYFLRLEGFTLGVHDILVTSAADRTRRNIINECREIGNTVVASALDLETVPPLDELAEKMSDAYAKDPNFRVILDRKYKSVLDGYTNDINKTCLPLGLISKFPANNLQLMVLSGAKGSMVNTMQISCLLGQIELEGKRPPLMLSGKSLPSFTTFETSPKSGGFIDGRFMTGIQPQDFFFHCMAGREGLIDTAVKTSRSGYLQRCLIKHLEGLSIAYDLTVRDSDHCVIQFLYGEDGLDISKSKFISEPKFSTKFFLDNADIILRPKELSAIVDDEKLFKVDERNKDIRAWLKAQKLKKLDSAQEQAMRREFGKKRTLSAFTKFSTELRESLEIKNPNKINKKTGRRRLDEAYCKLWKEGDSDMKSLYCEKHRPCPDPVLAAFRPDCYYGSVSEKTLCILEDFKDKERKSRLASALYVKSMKALADPGEPVGLLAAQSIGEPSTQMTLNTFHFAGRGEMNVTLGIPRLREILMLASSNIKTPSMDIPIKEGQVKKADKLRIMLNRVTLSDILHFVKIKIGLVLKPERAHQYQLYFQLLPREAYQNDFCVRPKRVIAYMSGTFFKNLFRSIIKTSRAKDAVIEMGDAKSSEEGAGDRDNNDDDNFDYENGHRHDASKTKNSSRNGIDENISSDDELMNDDDDDATGIKLKGRKEDEKEYDEPDNEEELKDANADDDLEDVDGLDESDLDTSNNNENEGEDDGLIDMVLKNAMVHDYSYDKKDYLWCKITFNLPVKYRKPDITTIVRELAAKTVLHQVSNIKRAIIYKGANDEQVLKTDGINIVEAFQHNTVLNLNRLYANDIHAVARTYGIEAAARVITQEISNVFKVYGITVDRRHLSLIADYMTFDGTFRPLSRKGMENSASPLQQMSFESCLQFLKTAAVSGRSDDLNSPSSRLIVGLPVRNGTGAFDLHVKLFNE